MFLASHPAVMATGWLVWSIRDEALAGHVRRLLQSHDVQDGGSHVGQTAIPDGGTVVVGHVYKGYGI